MTTRARSPHLPGPLPSRDPLLEPQGEEPWEERPDEVVVSCSGCGDLLGLATLDTQLHCPACDLWTGADPVLVTEAGA